MEISPQRTHGVSCFTWVSPKFDVSLLQGCVCIRVTRLRFSNGSCNQLPVSGVNLRALQEHESHRLRFLGCPPWQYFSRYLPDAEQHVGQHCQITEYTFLFQSLLTQAEYYYMTVATGRGPLVAGSYDVCKRVPNAQFCMINVMGMRDCM
jgi:hypothetical protein